MVGFVENRLDKNYRKNWKPKKKKNEKIFDKKLNLNKNKVIEKKEVFCITYCKLFKLHLLLVSYW